MTDRVAAWALGRKVDPSRQEVVKMFPLIPVTKGDIVLVDGERCRVIYVRKSWEGLRYKILSLRVKAAPR